MQPWGSPPKNKVPGNVLHLPVLFEILAAGNLYQARMGPNSNTKTPETHNIDAQNVFKLFWKEAMLHHGEHAPVPSQLFWDL